MRHQTAFPAEMTGQPRHRRLFELLRNSEPAPRPQPRHDDRAEVIDPQALFLSEAQDSFRFV
ncbi:hypothetical protein ACRARG_20320 [Pseudooceanicola sp. C21-150M6]|uniref:hypothetical protein n=1 Tax=Pseudooceanicola sp. C21-150M6 TaxID=3434355 RepID=UPI003D7F67FF